MSTLSTSHVFKGGMSQMKKFIAPLVTLLLIAFSWNYAMAANIVQQPDGTYLNAATHQLIDASGNVLTQDGYRPAWGNAVYTNAINDTVTIQAGAFAAESTIVLPFAISGYKWCQVYLDVKHAAGDTAVTWVAVEPRAHFAAVSDSVYMGVWPNFGAGALSVPDSLTNVATNFGTTIVPAAGTGQKAWNGEKVVAFSVTRGRGDESTPQLWGFPRQRVIELKDAQGNWLSALYVSWRVRILYGPAAASKVRIVLHVVMGS